VRNTLAPFLFVHRKEIHALQAENYYLERQLFSYQKSIEMAHHHSSSTSSSPHHRSSTRRRAAAAVAAAANPSTANDALVVPPAPLYEPDPEESVSQKAAGPYLDRNASTDTEYA